VGGRFGLVSSRPLGGGRGGIVTSRKDPKGGREKKVLCNTIFQKKSKKMKDAGCNILGHREKGGKTRNVWGEHVGGGRWEEGGVWCVLYAREC